MIFTILNKFNLSDFKYKLSKTIGDNGNNLRMVVKEKIGFI